MADESKSKILDRIDELKSDLSSDVVIQHKEGYYEQKYPEGHYLHAYATWVTTKPRITVADQARKELRQIYISTAHSEIRRAAGTVLGYSSLRIFLRL
jgi:hypothetical protein